MRDCIRNILYEARGDYGKTHPNPWEMSLDEVRMFKESSIEPSLGMSLLYHGSKLGWNQIDQILENGILMSKAQGASYNEPRWIWSSLDKEEAYKRPQSVFTFQSRIDRNDQSVEQVNNSWVRFGKDISKHDILYCSKYYHIQTSGISFKGRLSDFSRNKLWHKYSIIWAIEHGFHVPNLVLQDYDWSHWDVVQEYKKIYQ